MMRFFTSGKAAVPLALGLSLLALGAATAPRAAHAQLNFNLTPASQSSLPGTTLTFTGTLSNSGATNLYLNGLNFNFSGDAGTYLANNDASYAFPAFLAPFGSAGSTYSGSVFTLDVAANTPARSTPYTGRVTFLGGGDANTFNDLAAQNFTVSVPEPGTLGLMGLGAMPLAGMAAIRLRRRRSRRNASR